MKTKITTCLILALSLSLVRVGGAEPRWIPTAVFPFQERGEGIRGYGAQAADLLFAHLAAHPDLHLVERQELEKTLQEFELSLSGVVAPAEAVRVGHLTGARVLLTGSVIRAGQSLYIVARIIGTETSRVLGESVSARHDENWAEKVEELAGKIATTLRKRGDELLPPDRDSADRIAALRERLGDAPRPAVAVRIPEQHIGRAAVDPAAETEMVLWLQETGFDVVQYGGPHMNEVNIRIVGEAFSEFAIRRGNLVSVRARLEVQAFDRATGRILATDRQTETAVDVAELTASKTALQQAGAAIAERLLPKLIGQ